MMRYASKQLLSSKKTNYYIGDIQNTFCIIYMNDLQVFPPHGFVSLVSHDANDLQVVNSARVSLANSSAKLDDSDRGLINFLMKNRHGTPFEHNTFIFNVRCPLFVAREWFRHRWSSFNEESLRYSRARLDGYIPPPEYVRSQVGKPGHYTFEQADSDTAKVCQKLISEAYRKSFDAYKTMIELGVAKELARVVLPLGLYTEFYWTVNARGLMNFLSLRNDEHAQLEIREYASAVEKFFAEIMPVTHTSFVSNGRVAP